MSSQPNPKVIGGFVLGAIALIVLSILIFSGESFFQKKASNVTFFPGTVQGLSVGAPVMFRGVQVGQVTRISLDYWPEEGKFLIPVYYDFWSGQLSIKGTGGNVGSVIDSNFTDIVEKAGLRAKLEVSSFVTGQYFVSLDLLPETEAIFIGAESSVREIPAVTATRDELAKILKEIDFRGLTKDVGDTLRAIKELAEHKGLLSLIENTNVAVIDFDQLLAFVNEEIGPLSNELETTLHAYQKLAKTTEKEVTSLSKAGNQTLKDISGMANISSVAIRDLAQNLEQTSASIRNAAVIFEAGSTQTFEDIDGIIGEDSSSRYNIGILVEELTGAARSLRLLADYIEKKPESLIFGK